MHLDIHYISCLAFHHVYLFFQEAIDLSGHSRTLSPSPPPLSPPFSLLGSQGSECSRSTTISALSDIHIPDNWKEDTQDCINDKVLDSDTRNDISRTIVTLLTAKFGAKFGRDRIEHAARKLILKYPFMADDIGSGYVSI